MQGMMEADASRHHGKAPDAIEWRKPEFQTFAVNEDIARGIGQLTKWFFSDVNNPIMHLSAHRGTA
jgi:hypothetical protein